MKDESEKSIEQMVGGRMICFSGAHRTGKTTLCQELAKHGYEFVPANMSQVCKDMGINTDEDLSFDARREMQESMLLRMSSLFEAKNDEDFLGQMVLCDRGPIDLMVYTATKLHEQGLLADEGSEIVQWSLDYFKRCVEMSKRLVGGIVLVQPGIPVVADAKSASVETQSKIAQGMRNTFDFYVGTGEMASMGWVVPEDLTDLEERVEVTRQTLSIFQDLRWRETCKVMHPNVEFFSDAVKAEDGTLLEAPSDGLIH